MIILYEDLITDANGVCQKILKWIGVDNTFRPKTDKIHNLTIRWRSRAYSRMVNKLLKQNGRLRKALRVVLPEYHNYKIGNIVRGLNKTKLKHKEMNPVMRQYLVEYYRQSNAELSDLIGRDASKLWNK